MKDLFLSLTAIFNIIFDLFICYATIMGASYLGYSPLTIFLCLMASFFLWPLRYVFALMFFPGYTGIPFWASFLFIMRMYIAVGILSMFFGIGEARERKRRASFRSRIER